MVIRYDKNQYLTGRLTPRFAAVISRGQHHLRASWQTGFHNPSPEQLFTLPVAGLGGEVGGLPISYNGAGLAANPGYIQADVLAYQTNPKTVSPPKPFRVDPGQFTTEKMQTWEVGYKTLIKDKFSVDAFYFASQYTNLISLQPLYQLLKAGSADFDLLKSANYRNIQLNTNSRNEVFVRGAGITLDYGLGDGFALSGNYTHQTGLITLKNAQGEVRNDLAGVPVIKRKMSNPEVAQLGRNYFNSPGNRYTITLTNPRLTDHLGAMIAYRWTDKMWYEQGITAGDVWLPAWSSLDAQVSYRMPALKSVIKLSGTNILNKYYAQGYGLAQIGGMYSVSVTFDELMR